MKTMLTVLALLNVTSALAGPLGIGTFSEYRVSGQGSGTYRIEIAAYDPVLKTYTQTYTTTINGSSEVESIVLPEDEVNTREMNESVIPECADAGGTLETVTVPAGEFKTCKLEMETGTVYSGPVPFGFVKASFRIGTVLELTGYEYK